MPFPSPGDLPDPGIETASPAVQADSEPPVKPKEPVSFSPNHYGQAKPGWQKLKG